MWNPALKVIKNNLTTPAAITHTVILTALFFSLSHNVSASEAIKVKTTAYKDIAINITHTLGGVVPAKNNSSLSAQISAVIEQFHADTGYEVK